MRFFSHDLHHLPSGLASTQGFLSVVSQSWLYIALTHIHISSQEVTYSLFSFTSHVHLPRGQPFSISFSIQVPHCYWYFQFMALVVKFSSSVKYQCKTQSSPSISPPGWPSPSHQTLPCTDSFPYANNKYGTEIKQYKEMHATLSKMCNADNIGGHSGQKQREKFQGRNISEKKQALNWKSRKKGMAHWSERSK